MAFLQRSNLTTSCRASSERGRVRRKWVCSEDLTSSRCSFRTDSFLWTIKAPCVCKYVPVSYLVRPYTDNQPQCVASMHCLWVCTVNRQALRSNADTVLHLCMTAVALPTWCVCGNCWWFLCARSHGWLRQIDRPGLPARWASAEITKGRAIVHDWKRLENSWKVTCWVFG